MPFSNPRVLSNRGRRSRLSCFGLLLPVSCALLTLLCDASLARAQDTHEAIHRKILAGEPVDIVFQGDVKDRSVDAEWIETAVARGLKVSISGASIRGTLNLKHATFQTDFVLDNCIVMEDSDFSYAVFNHNVRIQQTTFQRSLSFRSARFNQDVTIDGMVGDSADFQDVAVLGDFFAIGTRFLGVAVFDHARFERRALFNQATFSSDADFLGTQFGGDAEFGGARFEKEVRFWHTHFLAVAVFNKDPGNKHLAVRFHGVAGFFDTQFDSDVIFTGVTFDRDARFDNSHIQGCAYYRGAKFRGSAVFVGAVVGDVGDFSGVHFGGPALFNHAIFKRGALFRSDAKTGVPPVVFEKATDFTAVRFGGNVEFDDAKFNSELKLEHAEIEGRALFRGAEFTSSVRPTFRGAVFDQEAWFDQAKFNHGANFSGSQFRSEARFLGATFDDDTSFSEAHFAGFAQFSSEANPGDNNATRGTSFDLVTFDHARFDNDADFSMTRFKGRTSFRGTSFRAVYFSPTGRIEESSQFGGDLDFRDATYDRIQVKWTNLLCYPNGASRIRPYDRETFVELESVLRRVGAEKQANEVYLERRRVERASLSGGARILDWLYKVVGNYGNDLWNELKLAVLLLVCGACIFSRSGAVQSRKTGFSEETKISVWEGLWLGVHQFLPIALPAKPTWEPSRHKIFSIPWPYRSGIVLPFSSASYANLLRVSGFILVPLALVALTGVLRHVGP